MRRIFLAFLHQHSAQQKMRFLHLIPVPRNICRQSDTFTQRCLGFRGTVRGEIHLPQMQIAVRALRPE